MADEAKWYVVHTYSGYENKVATNLEKIVENRHLQDWIHAVFVPTQIESEPKDGEMREVERKTFPGYVLVKMVMTDESWYVVRNTRGCTGFVGPGGKPVPLTEEEVKRWGAKQKEIVVNYKVGDTIRIIDGPLENFSGIVDAIDLEQEKVHVTISMFGRETPVELELRQVDLMDD